MKRIALLSLALLAWSDPSVAGKRTIRPYNVVDASAVPTTLDVASTVKLLPKKSRPVGKTPHRCLVLQVDLRMGGDSMTLTSIHFDQFSLTLAADGAPMTVPAVGVAIGPLPLKPGDPEEAWQDRWEIGEDKGAFALGGNPGKTSKIKLLFIVPEDISEVTLMQKGAGGEPMLVKAGIRAR